MANCMYAASNLCPLNWNLSILICKCIYSANSMSHIACKAYNLLCLLACMLKLCFVINYNFVRVQVLIKCYSKLMVANITAYMYCKISVIIISFA